MIHRIALLACAVALVVLGVSRHAAHDACARAQVDALSVTLGRRPVADAAGIAARLQAHCRDVEELVNGAVAFSRVGALRPAERLAGAAVHREPDRRNAWLALSIVLAREGDTVSAGHALDRARALDPVGLASAPGPASAG
ncbi:hypothetical protein FSW04_19675 [Baekduia soli]|uniref:Tetratricopeptide repeat protein n=1 Tax=Baekduia soli TaxID=496014 RepID=A0A5B8U971_9ACTN|nr:hypothetical protein [Baekduia soli]QEC49570.1 hypothetical protein FSW04_19675 [Baekduia soli]